MVLDLLDDVCFYFPVADRKVSSITISYLSAYLVLSVYLSVSFYIYYVSALMESQIRSKFINASEHSIHTTHMKTLKVLQSSLLVFNIANFIPSIQTCSVELTF